MSWVSLTKFKTVCEAIKNYVVEQCNDVYTKIETAFGDIYVKKSGDTMTGQLNVARIRGASGTNGLIYFGGNYLVLEAGTPYFQISETGMELYSESDIGKATALNFKSDSDTDTATINVTANGGTDKGHLHYEGLMADEDDIVTVKYVTDNTISPNAEITDTELATLTSLFS